MEHETTILLAAVQEAGQAITSLQKQGFSISRKANNDLLTQADLLANQILKKALTTTFPNIGWLSEECADDVARLACNRVWIVDPIDGTIEFAHGVPEYGISVALVEHGLPILAAVYNPATNELFHAIKGKGAWLNEKSISCCRAEPDKKMILLASRSEYGRGEWDSYQRDYEVKQVGSIAYKLALIAAGRGHATFSLGLKNEWDIAAGVLLVQEAGGIVTDRHRQAIRFNQEKTLVPGIVATIAEFNDAIFAAINA